MRLKSNDHFIHLRVSVTPCEAILSFQVMGKRYGLKSVGFTAAAGAEAIQDLEIVAALEAGRVVNVELTQSSSDIRD